MLGSPRGRTRNWHEEVEEDPWAEGQSQKETAIWEVGMAKKGIEQEGG